MEYSCQLCGGSCAESFPCLSCGALMYCKAAHRRIHASNGHSGDECKRMSQHVMRRSQLLHDPLHLNLPTAAAVCNWLESQHLHSKPLWMSACPIHSPHTPAATPEEHPPSSGSSSFRDKISLHVLPQTSAEWEAAWQLSPTSLIPPFQSPARASSPSTSSSLASLLPQDWAAYYKYRRVPGNSLAALVLSHITTLWYCLTQLLPSKGHPLPPEGSNITIHYLGEDSAMHKGYCFFI